MGPKLRTRNQKPEAENPGFDLFLDISLKLTGRIRKVIVDPGRTSAAVLVPLFLKNDRLHILFTVRTDTVATHKGQISFPGGVRDTSDDSLETTALRETEEELGIAPREVEILGILDDAFTLQSRFVITPVAGRIPWPCPLRPSAAEVAGVLEVPVEELQAPGAMTCTDAPTGRLYEFAWRGHRIWGATARILHGFFEVMETANGRPY